MSLRFALAFAGTAMLIYGFYLIINGAANIVETLNRLTLAG